MTTNPVDQGAGAAAPAPAPRLAFDAVIGAIFRIAFGRTSDHDIFRNASVRWIDFIGPIVVLTIINLAYELSVDPQLQRAMNASLNVTVMVLGLLVGGTLLRMTIGLGITFGLAKGAVAPERVGPGLLAYAWMQAVLVTPWTILGRTTLSNHHPEWLVLLLAGGIVVFVIYATSRIMCVAFGLSAFAWGTLFAFAGSVVSYVVDRLLPW
jgi:hypothetical protein